MPTKAELHIQLSEARDEIERLETLVASLDGSMDDEGLVPDHTAALGRAHACIRGAVVMSGRNGGRRWQRDHAPTIKAAHE